jgi:hypothetical protein
LYRYAEDFVWFILSEEDKSTPLALEYWFRCVDLDGNSVGAVHVESQLTHSLKAPGFNP